MTTAKKKVNVQQLVLCGIFTALIAIGAFIRIPAPDSVYPAALFCDNGRLFIGRKRWRG